MTDRNRNPFKPNGPSTNSKSSNGGPIRSESLNKRLVRITNSQSNQEASVEALAGRVETLEKDNRLMRELILNLFPREWELLQLETKTLGELSDHEKQLYIQASTSTASSSSRRDQVLQPPSTLQQGGCNSMLQQPDQTLGLSSAQAHHQQPAQPNTTQLAAPGPQLTQQQLLAQAVLAYDAQASQLLAGLAPQGQFSHQPNPTTGSLQPLVQLRHVGSNSSLASSSVASFVGSAQNPQIPHPSAGPIFQLVQAAGPTTSATTSGATANTIQSPVTTNAKSSDAATATDRNDAGPGSVVNA